MMIDRGMCIHFSNRTPIFWTLLSRLVASSFLSIYPISHVCILCSLLCMYVDQIQTYDSVVRGRDSIFLQVSAWLFSGVHT